MEQTSTSTDLIRYIYQETSTAENQQIESEIEKSPELQEELEELQAVQQCLNQHFRKPKQSTVDQVLDFARNKN